MLQIWGRLSSINVRKVVWCANELGLVYRHTEAGGRFGIVHTDAFRALNPNGLVPTIEEDDGAGTEGCFRLWESNVIVRYLCARHASGTLYPESLRLRFGAERWMDWQQTTLNPPDAMRSFNGCAHPAMSKMSQPLRARCRRPNRSSRCSTPIWQPVNT